jgi:hypothetical protein
MTQIKVFHGYEADKLGEEINKWILKNHIEVISTNTAICGFGMDGQYTNVVITVLYKEPAALNKEKIKAGYDAYLMGENEYMSR